jgi:very-short-patch-repair endonuclease
VLVARTLKRHGWRVLRIWQHDLLHRNEKRLIVRIRRTLKLV